MTPLLSLNELPDGTNLSEWAVSRPLPPEEKLVLLALCSIADRGGTCPVAWTNRAQLSAITGYIPTYIGVLLERLSYAPGSPIAAREGIDAVGNYIEPLPGWRPGVGQSRLKPYRILVSVGEEL